MKKDTYLLAIETSTEVCSVALAHEDQLLVLKEEKRKNSHTEKITLLIQECINEAKIKMKDLSGIILSEGPGSYTGLRVGASAAKGLAYALDIPIIAVNTLQGLANGVLKKNHGAKIIIPMLDARRMEVYYGVYHTNGQEIKATDNMILSEDLIHTISAGRKTLLVGNGAEKCKSLDLSDHIHILPTSCSAADLIIMGHHKFCMRKIENLDSFEPFYFKAPRVTKPKPKF